MQNCEVWTYQVKLKVLLFPPADNEMKYVRKSVQQAEKQKPVF